MQATHVHTYIRARAQLTSLAIRLAPRDSAGESWADWILMCFTTISGAASSAYARQTDRIPLIVPARRPHARQAARARISHHRCRGDTYCRRRGSQQVESSTVPHRHNDTQRRSPGNRNLPKPFTMHRRWSPTSFENNWNRESR